MNVINKLQSLRRQEHESTVAIIEGLVECYESKAHVDLGYSTIWPFLVEHLNYSNAAASRRYKAMKCAMKCPAVLELLREHRVSLSSLAKVETVLCSSEDPGAVLDAIDGCPESEVERVVARLRPVTAKPRERVQRQFVNAKPAAKQAGANLFTTHSSNRSNPTSAPELVAPAEERVSLKFSVTPEQYEAFERARAIVSRKTGRVPSVEESFSELVAFFLSKKAPKARRRAKPPAKPRNKQPASKPQPRTRHIPAALRDEVMLRDGQRCAFVGTSGRRCGETHDLQIDHVRPFAQGGGHEAGNLRVLCAAHNRRRAELTFGRDRVPHRKSLAP